MDRLAELIMRISEVSDSILSIERKRYIAEGGDPNSVKQYLERLFEEEDWMMPDDYGKLAWIVRLLTYGRILEPASKIATMRQNEAYYTPLATSDNDIKVYNAPDIIYEYRKQIIRRMNTCISRGIGRNSSTVFYDVTNFFFEIEEPDEDVVDEDGNVTQKGLRKMGVSKENRKQPIVQMGLFLDDNGIPISIEMFPGNTLDHQTLCTAMKNTVDTLNLERFILIADKGMYIGPNLCHVLDQGNGYIISRSLKKSTKKDRQWTLEQEGYTVVGPDFKYKSRIICMVSMKQRS